MIKFALILSYYPPCEIYMDIRIIISIFCFVSVDALHLSQQFFSHVGTTSGKGLILYKGVKGLL